MGKFLTYQKQNFKNSINEHLKFKTFADDSKMSQEEIGPV